MTNNNTNPCPRCTSTTIQDAHTEWECEDCGFSWAKPVEHDAGTNPSNPREEDSLKRQVHRLIIENQSEDGSIDISDQNCLATDFLNLISSREANLKNSYEQKVQDLAVETYVHSKIHQWADSHRYPSRNQNRYIGLEGVGYQSAQEEVLKLLPLWRAEAAQTNGEGNAST